MPPLNPEDLAGPMTHLQLVRHVSRAHRPAPSRASLWLASVGIFALLGAAVLVASEMGWFGT